MSKQKKRTDDPIVKWLKLRDKKNKYKIVYCAPGVKLCELVYDDKSYKGLLFEVKP